MAKSYFILLFALATLSVLAKDSKIIERSQGRITFVVDGNLPFVNYNKYSLWDGDRIAAHIIDHRDELEGTYRIVATSFADEQNLSTMDVYTALYTAFAQHRSVTLSPDVIWLLISQGFSRYVNAHAEELRYLLVSHSGKKELVVFTERDLLSEPVAWPRLIGDFASQIDQNTKGDIANIITADFSTTGPVERVASQVTLMESMKSYFNYTVVMICGIPSITLTGTPEDWQRVLDKTMKLKHYGLDNWIESLEPILKEFVRTAEGHPDQRFWQDIVMKKRVDEVRGSGSCGIKTKPTEFDGWFLKLFPDENGETFKTATMDTHMPSERVAVPFKYKRAGLETAMELWAGFVGTEVDTVANMLTPKIGWLALVAPSDDEILKIYKEQEMYMGGIYLHVKEVPEALAKMEHIKLLNIDFTNKVVLPEWFDRLTIDRLAIGGKMSNAEKEAILKRFPKAVVVQR